MGVPDYQSMMLPLLQLTTDKQLHRVRDHIPTLATQFGLTAEDQAQLLPSGTPTFENRVFWAVTYLRKAGLIQSPSRGYIEITPAGVDLLAKKPPKISNALLMQYPSFQEFRKPKSVQFGQPALPTAVPDDATPEETMEATSLLLRNALGQDVLAKIKSCSPKFFEQLVVDLLVSMGYGGSVADAGKTLGQSGDGGLDGIIKEDRLGLDVVYVQAKRWEGQVGRPTVQAFAGSLEGAKARKGVMITTSAFSAEALNYVKNIEKRIVLIDGAQLVDLMMVHNVGVDTSKTYLVQKMDLDYFEED
jgi:restriction system protein